MDYLPANDKLTFANGECNQQFEVEILPRRKSRVGKISVSTSRNLMAG